MYFLYISLLSSYGIRLTFTHAELKVIALLQVDKVFCFGEAVRIGYLTGMYCFELWGKGITRKTPLKLDKVTSNFIINRFRQNISR